MATALRPLTAAETLGRGRKFAYCLTRGTPIIGGNPVGSARRMPAKRRPMAGLALAAIPPSVGSARAAFGLRAGRRFFLLSGGVRCVRCSVVFLVVVAGRPVGLPVPVGGCSPFVAASGCPALVVVGSFWGSVFCGSPCRLFAGFGWSGSLLPGWVSRRCAVAGRLWLGLVFPLAGRSSFSGLRLSRPLFFSATKKEGNAPPKPPRRGGKKPKLVNTNPTRTQITLETAWITPNIFATVLQFAMQQKY